MELKQLTEYIIKKALKEGADQVDVMAVKSTTNEINVRLGEIEKLGSASPKRLGIRVIKNHKNAITSTSDFREKSIDDLVSKTVQMAGFTSADEYSGLPEKGMQGIAAASLNLFDEKIPALTTDKKIDMAKKMEKIGMSYDKRIVNSDGAGWSDSVATYVLADSNGFYGEQTMTRCGLSLSLLAEENGVKQTDSWYSGKRFFEQLDSIEEIAEMAAKRTLRKLGSVKPETQKVPVVFDPQAGEDFLNIIASVILGSAIYRKQSFLLDMLNQSVGVEGLTIIDDGLMKDGIGSRLFDDEGLPSCKNIVIEKGILKTWLLDTYSGKKLGLRSTGNASRGVGGNPSPSTSNFYMEKGIYSPDEIIRSVKNGLYLTSVHWTGINYITGDYSRGAEGVWIKDGELDQPVQEFTVASNMKEMMKNIEMIGNDLEFRGSVSAPTFKIAEMTISGK
ncbi:MAG: TldD/PmbA family protein [Candidatus Marinimicrobia bacterium]|nr:TldD/PmbA family protein [Candidatus Neomarinimicrobiota bacterium]